MIDELFLNHLLDLVEKTRDDEDETFNYSVICLIVSPHIKFWIWSLYNIRIKSNIKSLVKIYKLSFNEQFMLAAMTQEEEDFEDWNPNTVLRVLGARIGSSKTFGENVIFMLNRAGIIIKYCKIQLKF
jgi:hypothetical protein